MCEKAGNFVTFLKNCAQNKQKNPNDLSSLYDRAIVVELADMLHYDDHTHCRLF